MFFAPPKEIIPDLQRQNNFSPYGNDHVYCDFKYHSMQLYVTRIVNIFCDMSNKKYKHYFVYISDKLIKVMTYP